MASSNSGLLAAAMLDTASNAPRSLGDIEAEGLLSRPGMRIVPTQTCRVRIRIAPVIDAPTLVLLPDGPDTIEHYDPVFAHYAHRLTVIAIDVPGFGFSYATDPCALTFEGCVDACHAVLDNLGLNRLVLTGPCVLAYVAIALANRLETRALGVVAMQATDVAGEKQWVNRAIDPSGVLRTPEAGQRHWAEPGVREAQAVDRWYSAAAAPGFDVKPWQAIARWTIRAGCSNALPSLCQMWFGDAGGLNNLLVFLGEARVLFGAADRTHAANRSDPRGLLAYLPNASIRVLSGVGHFPDLEALTEFTEAVDEIAQQSF